MPLVTSKRVWTQQPQYVVEKDASSALYRGAARSSAVFVGNNSTIAKVNGAHGVASSFNGTSNYATIGGMPNVPETTMFLLVRFRSAVTGSSIKQPIGRSADEGKALLGMSWDHTSPSFRKVWQVARSYVWYPTPYLSELNAGEYYLLSATATTTQLRIFKNGALDNVGSFSGSTHTPLSNLYVGSGDSGGVAGSFIDADIVLAGEIPLAMTDAWHRELADNPWKLLKRQDRGIWVPSAGGGATALAGNAQAIAAASGALSVSTPVALAGAAVGVVTSTGAISSAMPLSGAAASVAGAAGNITFGLSISGAALAAAVASGVLGTQKPLSGGAQVAVTATGNLQASSPSGLAGDAQAAAAATGQMQVQFSISGAALMEALATGGITVTGSTALAGNAPVVATAYGDMTIAIPLAGAAQIVASSTGDLHNGKPLAGSSVAVSAASGLITVTASLSGDGVAQAIASGFMALQIPLSGAALMQALAMGSLGTGADLQPGSDRYRVYYPAKTRRVIMPSQNFKVIK